MVDMYSFPPPGMFVKDYPKALWESTIASIDAELILCGLVKRRTYNQRAVSSQLCESLFGSLASLSSSRNGVPNCVDLETSFAKICGEMVVRYDPCRGFPVRLSSASIYPQQELEIASSPNTQPMDPPTYISEITLMDHPFDKPDRRRTARRRLKGLTKLHEPGKGVTGVRGFHKVNEGRLSGLVRLGKSAKTNL
ncbi:uncharacterized protein [Ptychodera flava]|uniref:uncharacterized protein n=1 Tax=Ptychodera flava TaxID=63121 RepID=UPI00396AAA6A